MSEEHVLVASEVNAGLAEAGALLSIGMAAVRREGQEGCVPAALRIEADPPHFAKDDKFEWRVNGGDRTTEKLPRRTLLRGLAAAALAPMGLAGRVLEAEAPAAPRLTRPGAAAETASGAAPRTYKNPLKVDVGDPYVLREPGGSYTMYGTGGGAKGSRTAFPAWRSMNLLDWTPLGETFVRDPESSWCEDFFWAPEVYVVKGKFVMVYSAQWRHNPTKELENFRIGVAVADRPEGPFRDVRNEPLFDPGYPIIDADVLFDADGRMYLYYSRCCYKHPVESEIAEWAKAKGWYKEIEESWIYGVELKTDFSGVIGEPVVVLRPPVSFADVGALWENRSVLTHEVNRRWTEGPTAFRYAGRYYVMYSANSVFGPEYALGYATAEHPLGPFTKAANNPVAQKNTGLGGDVTTTAHNCVTLSPSGTEMYCLYGARNGGARNSANAGAADTGAGDRRVLFLERMRIAKDGILTVDGPDDVNELLGPV